MMVPSKSVRVFFQESLKKSTEKGSKTDRMLCGRESIGAYICLRPKSMRDMALSINFYLYNLMTDERQRESHEIVQSPA